MGAPIKYSEEFVYEAVLDGIFIIDKKGRIWRVCDCQYAGKGKPATIKACIKRRAEADNGDYLQVHFCRAGEKRSAQASRLVWRYFFGSIPKGLTINHKNGKKKDNRPCNLELATDSEQQLHAIRVLNIKPHKNFNLPNFKGINNGRSKVTVKQVKQIRKASGRIIDLAKQFNLSPAQISSIRLRNTWRHV